MSGFVDGDPAGILATWVAAGVTLAVWSYFVGGRRVFRLAQYLLAGLATGYFMVLAIREVLLPDLLQPLVTDTAQPALWLALGLVGIVAGARWLPPALVSLPVAVLVAGTAAFALGGAVVGTVLPQLAASLVRPAGSPISVLNGLISMVVTVLVLVGFLHGTRQGRIGASATVAGRWLLLGGIGGWLGFLLVSRLAVLVDRIQFLLGDWLGLVR